MVHGDIYLQEKLRQLERDRRHGRQVMEARRLFAGSTRKRRTGLVRAVLSSVASFLKRDNEALADEAPSGRTQGRDGGRHATKHPEGGASSVLPETAVS